MTSGQGRLRARRRIDDDWLHALQKATFTYFWHETNPANGLIPDNTLAATPASIAGVGLALATYVVGVARGFVTRTQARERTLATLRFFWNSTQGTGVDATGYRGFFYHFLDVKTGRRAWRCELSTIDTTILLGGVLTAAAFFDRDSTPERELRSIAEQLYGRVDWHWAQNDGATVTNGWTPERGFIRYRWQGFNEGLLLYVLGLGSPTCPLPEASYLAWTSTYRWKTIYGHEFLFGGPLFMHQLSHLWIDFRGIQDAYMRAKAIDYFENSRRATYVQQAYAIRNPRRFTAYGERLWGITASNGPGPATRRLDGVTRRFLGYRARAVPNGPDDGTLAPWGSGGVAAVRTGNRLANASALSGPVPRDREGARTGVQHQPHVPRIPTTLGRLDLARTLRARSRSGRPDDRELPLRPAVAAHAPLSPPWSSASCGPASGMAG